MGRVRSIKDKIGGLLLAPHIPPDLMVELLPPMLWLEHATGYPTNMCVSSCVTLHFAYAALGIRAVPRAVDLVVHDQRTDQRTFYGRPDPAWSSDDTFNGHCVLHLPGSGRLIDPTVEQYPEVRHYRLGPICGRTVATAATGGTAEERARLDAGELIPGVHIGVQRGELLLLYTAVEQDYDDVVMAGVRDTIEDFQRSGRNLAMKALAMLAQPEVITRARKAPHPRVRGLLDLLAGAELNDDEETELRFVLRDDHPNRAPWRLDELLQRVGGPPATTSTRATSSTRLRNWLGRTRPKDDSDAG